MLRKDAYEINFDHHKFEDLSRVIMVEREIGDWIRFNQYTGTQLPVAGDIKVQFRSYYQDVVFAETTLVVDPNDNRKATMSLDFNSIDVNRSKSVFFNCIGRDVTTGLQTLIFYGKFNIKP